MSESRSHLSNIRIYGWILSRKLGDTLASSWDSRCFNWQTWWTCFSNGIGLNTLNPSSRALESRAPRSGVPRSRDAVGAQLRKLTRSKSRSATPKKAEALAGSKPDNQTTLELIWSITNKSGLFCTTAHSFHVSITNHFIHIINFPKLLPLLSLINIIHQFHHRRRDIFLFKSPSIFIHLLMYPPWTWPKSFKVVLILVGFCTGESESSNMITYFSNDLTSVHFWLMKSPP